MSKAFGLRRAAVNQIFVPSSEGQVRAVLAGWGVSVVPELLARGLDGAGPADQPCAFCALPIQLYWHCWNLESEVLDALSAALSGGADRRRAGESVVLVAARQQGFAQGLRLVLVEAALGARQYLAVAIENQHRSIIGA